jgi:hypothetical protein
VAKPPSTADLIEGYRFKAARQNHYALMITSKRRYQLQIFFECWCEHRIDSKSRAEDLACLIDELRVDADWACSRNEQH